MGPRERASQIRVVLSDGNQHSEKDFTETIAFIKSWGFTQTFKHCRGKPKRRPEIHFWAEPSVSPETIAFLLGHEVGHNIGTKKTGLREELRADAYGEAAREVVAQMRHRRMLAEKSRRSRLEVAMATLIDEAAPTDDVICISRKTWAKVLREFDL